MKLPRPLIALIAFLFIFVLIAAPAHTRGVFRESSAGASSNPAANPDGPVATDDGPYTIHKSALLNPPVMGNDSGTNIHFDIIGQGPSHGALTFGGDPGDIYYHADNIYVGPDSFTYRISDQFGNKSNFATVSINVVNQAPVAVDDLYVIRGNQYQLLLPDVLANDYDPDPQDYLLFDIIVQNPTHGFLSVPGNGTDIIYYQPFTGYTGIDSFTYKMADNLAVRSNIATVTLMVLGGDENFGADSCAAVGKPINVTNGNMYLQQTDHSLPSTGRAIDITRTYNSSSKNTGLFGRGWSTAYDESITSYSSDFVRLTQPDGRGIYLSRAAGSSGGLLPLEGDFHGQVTPGGGGFTLSMKDGSVHQFNSAGKLLSLADRNGNTTVLGYDTNGILVSITDPFGRVLTVSANTNGQVLSISDTLGTIASYTYGGSNVLLSVVYADNSRFQFSYDGTNRLTSVTDALANVLESHTYDDFGRAITSEKQGGVEHYSLNYLSANETDVTDALGHVTNYTFDTSKGRNVITKVEGLCNCGGGGGSQIQNWTYDSQLNPTSMTDALGHVTSYTYDSSGNRLSETNALGTSSFTYNQFGDVLTATDRLGNLTTNTYDAAGNLLSSEDALHHTSTLTYNTRGQLLTGTDARGKTTTLTYSATTGTLTKTKDAFNQITTYTYDVRNRVTRVQDPLGRSTYFAYDAAGRQNKITHADNTFVTFTYDLAGRRTVVTDERGNATNYAYDGAYRSTGVTDALGHTTSYTYDQMSNLTSTTDSLSRVTNYEYDDFNRRVKTTYPPATTGATRLFETVAYDAAGNVTQRTDTAGRVTSYAYDNVNRMASTTDADNKTTGFEYDALSRVTAVVDALNQHYQFFYDALGRQIQTTRGGTSMFNAYDEVGNRTQRTDYNGAVTSYAYDNINRLKTITYPTRTVSYGYNPANEITNATNENGSIYLGYDNRYRLNSVFDPFNYGISYNYDGAGNRTKLSLNYATYATYTYDAVNRLTSLKDSTNQNFPHNYDAANRLTSRSAPNGVTTSYGYDGLDRLTALTHATGATTLVSNQYQYNDANNITNWANASGNHAYTYDSVDRLASATHTTQPNESYSHDGVGNRTASHLSASYNYQPFNKLTNTATASYVYDNNGNLLSRSDSLGTTTFSWNEENQLTQVTLPNSVTVNYKYDALGRRLQRTTSAGASERYVYDGANVLLDLNADWSVAATYLNGPGIDNHLRQTSAVTGIAYFLTDHLGSTAGLTDATGNVAEQLAYDSFGNSAGSTRTRYGYTGRERDADSGLMYYRARWYDPTVGRFVGEDPIGFNGGTNFYTYVKNQPLRFADPLGLCPQKSGVEFLPKPTGGSYGERGQALIKSIIDSLLQNERCRRAFEIVGLQTINQTVEKGVVIGPATLLNNPANNSTMGITDAARQAYSAEFNKGANGGTIYNMRGQPFPFASRQDQRPRMFFATTAFDPGWFGGSYLRESIIHEFIHAGGQDPISSWIGHDLSNYEWYDFLQESCK
jgi:RHS repeat-associated protein